jgi:DNA-binding PadR family transcriptional regulator
MDPRFHEHDNEWHESHHDRLRQALRGGGPRGHRGDREGRGDGGFGRFGRGGFGFDPDMMGRGPRRGRGDVRTAVLMLLTERPMHGYEMIQEIRARSEEAWSPSPGAIYPTLQLLLDEGLVASDDSDGKKVFRLTDAGRTAADELVATKTAPWEQASADAGDSGLALRRSIAQLIGAIRQTIHAGSDAERKRTTEILDEARRKIYAMLATDES